MEDKDIAEVVQDVDVSENQDDLQPEKMLPASRVDQLVKNAKNKGERRMQEQLNQLMQEIEQLKAAKPEPPEAAAPQQTPQPGMNAEQIQAQVMEQLRQEMQEKERQRQQELLQQEVNQVADQYYGKMAQGKDLYDDFEQMTADFDPAAFPQLVFLANQMDNTAAIIYELKKNPGKLAQLAVLVEKSPTMARNQLGELSKSIKMNEEAQRNEPNVQEPLSRMKSSQVGADNGTKTVADFKNAPYLRG